MLKEIFNYFLISSVVIGFIFIISTLFSKRGRDKSIIYLNLVIVFLTLNYTQIVLLDTFFTEANFFIRTLRIPFYVLILPAFYTFVTYYLNVESKIKSFVIISSLLFLSEVLIRIVLFPFYYNVDQSYVVAQYRQIEEIINILFCLFLFGKAFLLLFNQSTLYQYILTFDNIKWLKKFMLLASLIMITWVFAVIFNLDKVLNPPMFIYYPLRLCCAVLIFWLGYEGLFNYSLLSERMQLRKEIAKNESKISRGSFENNLTKSDKFLIVKNYIQDNTSYLNPEFSLDNLASEIKMSTSSLSQIINNESNYNFSDYVNSLRVEKAKEYLASDEYQHYTILSIGLECGFNSKSTFYLAFKKFTNQTPTEFRKQNQ
ncbi:MAG: helix-turn-helix domain-containing protein [Bacteroidota bacterium]